MGSNTVLLIDDDVNCLELQTLWLERAGFQVVTATCAEEGIAKALANKPCVIVCDMHMRKHNGIWLADQCKRDPRLMDIPLLAITGLHSMYSNHLRITEHGYAGILFKPIDQSPEFPDRVRALCNDPRH